MTTNDKLQNDLADMAAMAEEMEGYLNSEVLYWPLGGRPMLTLGGYLMRQHRLLALADDLNDEQQETLNTAVSQFLAAIEGRIVRFETKANREIEARLRQWGEHLRDVKERKSDASLYKSGVESRIALTVLMEKLATPPYKLDPQLEQRLNMIDTGLRANWRSGDFILDEALQPAYERETFWYLYGKPV